jgi:hypothetical protein
MRAVVLVVDVRRKSCPRPASAIPRRNIGKISPAFPELRNRMRQNKGQFLDKERPWKCKRSGWIAAMTPNWASSRAETNR